MERSVHRTWLDRAFRGAPESPRPLCTFYIGNIFSDTHYRWEFVSSCRRRACHQRNSCIIQRFGNVMAKCCGEIMSGEDISRSWQNGLYQNYQSDSIHCISDLLLASQIVRNESDFFYFDFNLLLACFFSRPLSCCRIDGRQMQQLKWLPQWLWPRYEFGECRINRHKHVKRWKFWNIPLKKIQMHDVSDFLMCSFDIWQPAPFDIRLARWMTDVFDSWKCCRRRHHSKRNHAKFRSDDWMHWRDFHFIVRDFILCWVLLCRVFSA